MESVYNLDNVDIIIIKYLSSRPEQARFYVGAGEGAIALLFDVCDYRFKIGDFAPTRPVDPKFQVEGVAPHQPFSFPEN